ncbi:MAG: LytTR family transcriptional regulator DNA-binding domain-containing protein [Agriterribacter sp.]
MDNQDKRLIEKEKKISPDSNEESGCETINTHVFNDDNVITSVRVNGFLSDKDQQPASKRAIKNPDFLFKFFIKNGEYAYARANDIVMIESCDHLVIVHLAFGEILKKTIRHDTLKDFLLQLPKDQFIRIGRFCAINMQRLSGGSCKNQTFEFDFKFSVKLKHVIPNTIFNGIGN